MVNWIDLTKFIDLLEVIRVREWGLQIEDCEGKID